MCGMAVSVEDLEWEILRASGLSRVGDVMEVVGSDEADAGCGIAPSFLTGEGSLLMLIDRTACCSSFHVCSTSRLLAVRVVLSSPSEFSEESGGEMMAPVGMTRSFRGGGDCRRLVLISIDSASFDPELNLYVAALASCVVGDVTEGLRRCLFRYAVEDIDLGRDGRLCEGERLEMSWL